jgi:hypothetical protein
MLNYKLQIMKKSLFFLGLLTTTALFSAFTFLKLSDEKAINTLPIGAEAPKADLKMKATNGAEISIKGTLNKKGVLVVFSCNTCPFVAGAEGYGEGWSGRYNEVYKVAKENGIGMLLVNSNEGKREMDDSFNAMKEYAEDQKYQMPYVLDQNSVLADAFGARTTPHVFLFDNQLKLVYKGAIDDNNESASDVKSPYLKNAMNALGKGETITEPETRNMGCSIKRKK